MKRILCPIIDKELNTLRCPARQCMYNRDSACNFNSMQSVEPREWLESKGLLAEAQRKAKQIIAWIQADQFCVWCLNKHIDHISQGEIDNLLEDEQRIKKWANLTGANPRAVQVALKREVKLRTERNEQ